MCFGPVASFTSGAVLSVAGAACLKNVRSGKEVLIASFPAFFAFQQVIEGFLWLVLGKASLKYWEQGLAVVYLLFAYGFWPVFSPLAAYRLEPDPRNRKKIFPLIFLGIAISAYLLSGFFQNAAEVYAVKRHLHYKILESRPDFLIPVYATVIFLPFQFSSYKPVIVLAWINIVFCAIAYFFYHQGFDSVWCFFAAALSTNIYLVLRWLHRQPVLASK